MPLSESDTRAKLIDPALHARGWTEDLIRREETAGTIEIVGEQARKVQDRIAAEVAAIAGDAKRAVASASQQIEALSVLPAALLRRAFCGEH